METGDTTCRAGETMPMRILVVDDHRDAAEALVDILRIWGHDAWPAYDGHAALSEAADRRPDAVLLDIGLPEMDGYEVAHRLRDDATLAPMKIFALTGYGLDTLRPPAEAAHFDGHLTKPVDLPALERLLAGG